MEWLALAIPVLGFLWMLYRDKKKDSDDDIARITELETRVTVLEEKVSTVQKDLIAIERLQEEISQIKVSIARVLALLEK